MKKLVKIEDFKNAKHNKLQQNELDKIIGGQNAATETIENYTTSGGDSESWVYDDSGQVPISGQQTDNEGVTTQVYP